MTIDRRAVMPAAFAVFAAGLMTPAAAQNTQDTPPPPRGLESLAPQAVPVPPPPVIVLPTVTPTRPAPTTRTPRTDTRPARDVPKAEPAAPEPKPSRAPTPSQASTPTPDAASVPAPDTAPTPTPVPEPVTNSQPQPQPQPQPTLSAPETARTMPIWVLPAVIVAVLAGLWALTRRRKSPTRPVAESDRIEPTPEPIEPAPVVPAPVEPTPPPVASPPEPQFLTPAARPAPRARLAVELRPLRAGLNLLSAVVECELVVTNTGETVAEGIRIGATLLTAHNALDTDLAALTAAPIGRPATPPFALAPGETRSVRAVAATPRDAIRTMTAANRPMFVPIVSVNLLYPDGQTTRAWAIGIERVDSAKLAPFWLDAPAKMYADIGARPHAAAFER